MKARIFQPGYNMLTEQHGQHQEMLMDLGVYLFRADEAVTFMDPKNESAFLLLDGSITIAWEGEVQTAERQSVFDDMPVCLHVPRGIAVTITAQTAAEVLIQKTANERVFPAQYYPASSIQNVVLGKDNLQGCATRILRDIFNYENAPYSNMVLGEDVHLPGRWSSYPPHHHPQPEVYYYRFDHPQGFGVSIIDDTATQVTENHISAIPGGVCHPQAAAPGYAMYYAWMIRHLEGKPWTDRVDDPDHTWLHDPNAKLWTGPKEK